LNGTDGEKRKNFEIDPAAKCGREGALCRPECERASACVGGFVGGTDQEMRKRRHASRKAKLRAGERTDAPANLSDLPALPRLPSLADVLRKG